MSSGLEASRDHFRKMANGTGHREDCPALLRKMPWAKTPPDDGCVPPADRALFARLADEIDAYLAGDLCPDCGQPRDTPDDQALWEDASP